MILAGVVITTLTGENGILTKTHESEFKTDIATFQDELRISIANDYLEKSGQRTNNDKYNAKGYENIIKIIPSFKKKYESKLEIKEDELVYIGVDELERKWMSQMNIELAKKLTINYVDTAGNKIAESYITTVPNNRYSIRSPQIDGYMPTKDVIEGELTEDTELTVEYYSICNDLEFIGLDSNGNETEDESSIVAYTVSGIGNCNNPKIAVPTEYNGKPVTQILKQAFYSNQTILGIIIPNSVINIGTEAFRGCSNLIFASINSQTLGDFCFFQCNKLESVELKESVCSFGTQCFLNSKNLRDIMIYSEKLSIGDRLFAGCTQIKEFKVNENNQAYTVKDGVLYSKDETTLVLYPPGRTDDFIIPPGVITIGYQAFYTSRVSTLEIPSTVQTVEDKAFTGSDLKSIIINAQKLGRLVFHNCTQLENVVIGSNVSTFGTQEFLNCTNLKDVTIYSENLTIPDRLFLLCKNLKELKVNEDNQSYKIIDGLLYSKDGTKLLLCPAGKTEKFVISNKVTTIGNWSFGDTTYTELNYEGTIEEWNKITKMSNWLTFSKLQKVICSDGEIEL